ncbi:MCE family protein [bacterium]|nr:MCE family protein [bacterium]
MERKLWNDVALGAFILAALGLLAYMSVAVGGLKLGKAIIVTAKFDNAAGLVKDGAVMIAGVNVGSVESLSVAHDKALVKLRLKTDADIRQDVKAAIRMKSLLGEKYIELLPQSESAPLLKDGETIGQTDVPVEVDELMKYVGPVLKDVDPKDLSSIVHSLATTLGGRGESMGKTLDTAGNTLATLDRILTKNEDKLAHMIDSLDRTADAAPSLINRLDRMTSDLEPATKALGKRGPDLLARLDRASVELAPTVTALGKKGPALIDHADQTLVALDPTLTKLPKTLDALEPSLSRLPKTLDTLDKLVNRLDATLGKLDPILDQTKGRELVEKDGSLKVKARLF